MKKLFLAALFVCVLFPSLAICGEPYDSDPMLLEWGGHLKLRGAVTFPENGSRLDFLNHERLHDGAFELRLKNGMEFRDQFFFECHYEMIGSAGETRKTGKAFEDRYPEIPASILLPEAVDDDRRIMDLTHELSSDSDYLLYHRIDRLAFSLTPEWGSVRVGRQAVTWGNGFLFNPMDLFNPFAPTDVERDYKMGDDLVSVQAYTGGTGEIQVLYVPRRDLTTHDIKWNESSLAAKYHFRFSETDVDIMAGRHYSDEVLGAGFSGYLKDAAWRFDTTYTWLDNKYNRNGFASFVANMDYSWVWWGKNCYGWIEYHYTGLGKSDYIDALTDPDIMTRVARGERFTLGRSYVNTQLQTEWHPLVNGFITVIANTADPSGIVQPRVVLDPAQNFQVILGGNIYWGKSKTEFGGIEIPGMQIKEVPADMVYVWLSYFF